MGLAEAIRAYIDRFEEGPPVYGMETEEAVALIRQALERGTPMHRGAETDIPGDAVL